MKFKCIFCFCKCKFSKEKSQYYCDNHESIKICYTMKYKNIDEINYYEMIKGQYRAVISMNNFSPYTSIFNDNVSDIRYKKILSLEYIVNFTPENFEQKMKTLIMFS